MAANGGEAELLAGVGIAVVHLHAIDLPQFVEEAALFKRACEKEAQHAPLEAPASRPAEGVPEGARALVSEQAGSQVGPHPVVGTILVDLEDGANGGVPRLWDEAHQATLRLRIQGATAGVEGCCCAGA